MTYVYSILHHTMTYVYIILHHTMTYVYSTLHHAMTYVYSILHHTMTYVNYVYSILHHTMTCVYSTAQWHQIWTNCKSLSKTWLPYVLEKKNIVLEFRKFEIVLLKWEQFNMPIKNRLLLTQTSYLLSSSQFGFRSGNSNYMASLKLHCNGSIVIPIRPWTFSLLEPDSLTFTKSKHTCAPGFYSRALIVSDLH